MTQITITVRQDGETERRTMITADAPDQESAAAAGAEYGEEELTEEEKERCAVVSDLADAYEYLEDSEVIKIRLIVQKAQERKRRDERG